MRKPFFTSPMTTLNSSSKIIDGKAIANRIQSKLFERVKSLQSYRTKPKLAVILVGYRKDSKSYVTMKERAAQRIGIDFQLLQFSENVSQDDLLIHISQLNLNVNVHGIIVQLPLPSHISKEEVIESISPHKDVDGFHPLDFGKLALEGFEPLFSPCTPKGVMRLLKECNISLPGKHVVVLGKSNIVGLPMSMMLLKENATVTVCNALTVDEEMITQQADILISAMGCPQLVKKHWLKEGAIVIDVGINAISDDTKKNGYRLVGDVDYNDVIEKVGLITPVPGGVGPMTVAMLMEATVESFERHIFNKN